MLKTIIQRLFAKDVAVLFRSKLEFKLGTVFFLVCCFFFFDILGLGLVSTLSSLDKVLIWIGAFWTTTLLSSFLGHCPAGWSQLHHTS